MLARLPSFAILATAHGFKVPGIAAQTIAAKVIEIESFGYWPNKKAEGFPMHRKLSRRTISDAPVASSGPRAKPDPT
jgi:hypothetical protein